VGWIHNDILANENPTVFKDKKRTTLFEVNKKINNLYGFPFKTSGESNFWSRGCKQGTVIIPVFDN
jgi:hypothetical protein